MSKDNTRVLVLDVVGAGVYYAIAGSLTSARAKFKKLSGKFPSSKATIMAFLGREEAMEHITVDKLCQITWPQGVTGIRVQ